MTAHSPVRAGRPAQFDPASQHRRAMLAKVHMAKKALEMHEDDYRQALLDHTGKPSAADCSEDQLARLLDWFRSKGWQPLPTAGGRAIAQHPVARKARALWISLYHLGVVHNRSEQALEAFARRQLGCERLNWARQSDGHKLIEALKSMAERAGWRQREVGTGKRLDPTVLASSLCECILARLVELGVAGGGWSLETAAFRLCGEETRSLIETAIEHGPFAAEHYHHLAAALGARLREAAPNAAHVGDGQ